MISVMKNCFLCDKPFGKGDGLDGLMKHGCDADIRTALAYLGWGVSLRFVILNARWTIKQALHALGGFDAMTTHSKMADIELRDEAGTPDFIFDPLNDVFGFYLDLAASKGNAKCPSFFSKRASALNANWPQSEWCWLNPPFSQLKKFMAYTVRQSTYGAKVVSIMPSNRCNHRWFAQAARQASSIVMLHSWMWENNPRKNHGRFEYVAPEGITYSSSGFGSMLMVFGETTARQGAALASMGTALVRK